MIDKIKDYYSRHKYWVVAALLILALALLWIISTEKGYRIARTIIFIIAGYFAYMGLNIANRRANIADKDSKTNAKRFATDTYASAISSLESSNNGTRSGAISVLQKIAEDYPEDYLINVMEIFCDFARHYGKVDDEYKPVHKDFRLYEDSIKKAVETVGKLSQHKKYDELHVIHDYMLNLSGVRLKNIDLSAANFNSANLRKAALKNCDLGESYLNSANFERAYLYEVLLCDAELNYADIKGAKLVEVDFSFASLNNANLTSANILYNTIFYANLTDAKYNSQPYGTYAPTKFPEGFDPKEHEMIDVSNLPKNEDSN